MNSIRHRAVGGLAALLSLTVMTGAFAADCRMDGDGMA